MVVQLAMSVAANKMVNVFFISFLFLLFSNDFNQVGRDFGVYGYGGNSFNEYHHALVAFAFYFYEYALGAVERSTVYAHFCAFFYINLFGFEVGEVFDAALCNIIIFLYGTLQVLPLFFA